MSSTLEKVAIVNIDFDIWGGETVLEGPDLKLGHGGKIPPKKLVKLGRKALIDPIRLAPFARLKAKARTICERVGMPFLSGYAIPIKSIDHISAELDAISIEMDALKTDFLKCYDQWCEDWANQPENVEYAHCIRNGKLSAQTVSLRFGFSFNIFQVNPVNEEQADRLGTMASGLSENLLDEVVQEAQALFDRTLKGKERVNRKARDPLVRIREKVDGLAFLDGRLLTVVQLLDDALTGFVGSNGPLSGESLYRVQAAVLILTSKDQILNYADGLLPPIPVSQSPKQVELLQQHDAHQTWSDDESLTDQLSVDDDVDDFLAQCIGVPASTHLPVSNKISSVKPAVGFF